MTTSGRSEASTSSRRRTAHAVSAPTAVADSEELRETVTDGRPVRLRDHALAERARDCRGVSRMVVPAACESSSTSGANVTPSP